MKKILNKIADIIKVIFGYGIMICLLTGGFTFFGYVAALLVGGNTAELICTVIYKYIYPILVVLSTSMIVLGLIRMYIVGETALSGNSKKADNSQKNDGQESDRR